MFRPLGGPMDSVQGRNGFALNFDFAQLPVDPMNLPEKPQISGPRKATIFFAPFVGEGHPHSS